MNNQIFPTEYLDNTIEAYIPKVTVKSQLIYTSLLLVLVICLMLLPIIFIDVSVKSSGVIRAQAEKTEIKSLVSGKITAVNVSENETVIPNQILFTVTTAELETQIQSLYFEQKAKLTQLGDIRLLSLIKKENIFKEYTTQSPLYTQQLNTFRAQMQENLYHQKIVKRELEADDYLYKEKAISRRELEARKYEVVKLEAEYESAFNRQISQWQADLNQLNIELKQLKSKETVLKQQMELYEIKSPIKGNIQQIVGKYVGSYVQTGEVLGVISPDSSLLVECYVKPSDIGLLKNGMAVSFQLDAFNYNHWGLAQGSIIDIAKDFVLINEAPIFKVKCKLNTLELKLKNGYTTNLKKGLTTQARFVVAKRSLFQLIYDDIDDWLNPKAS